MKTSHLAIKKLIVFVLVISMTLSLCSCGFSAGDVKEKAETVGQQVGKTAKKALSKTEELIADAQDKIVKAYGSAKDSIIYVYDDAAELTSTGYSKASAKASEIIGDASEYIYALTQQENSAPDKYAIGDPNRPVRDLPEGKTFNETGAVTIDKNYMTEQFVTYYVSSILSARGYEVFNGAVYYKGEIYGGLIFTKGDVFIEENGQRIRSCGFIQLVSEDYKGVMISDSMVQTGLIAVSCDTYGAEAEPFIVEEYAVIDDFSGVFNDVYFCIHQRDHYVLSVSLKENKKTNYNSKIELYDFDNDKQIYKAEKADDVEHLYVEDYATFQIAATTVNSIVDVGDNSLDELASVFIMDGNVLDELVAKASSGVDAATDYIKSAVKGTKLANNQFLSLEGKGKAHVFGIENAEDEARFTNGIITTVSSGLATAGVVASVVYVVQAGGVVVTAIVITTGTCAIVYNVSNMLAGAQDIYYGAKGSTKESENPVLNIFKACIPDEETATLVYHIWGISNTVISGLMRPITESLNIAKTQGLNCFQTTANVIRASLVTIAKFAAAGAGAGIVSNYVSKVVTKVSGNEHIGKLAGFGTCLVTAFLVYQGLDAIDQKLDVSGLYPKATVSANFVKARETQKQYFLEDGVSSQRRGVDEAKVYWLVEEGKAQLGVEEDPIVLVVYDNELSYYGAYDSQSNVLIINIRAPGHDGIYELSRTIGHELEHAVQHQIALQNPKSEMAYSLNHYISPKPDNSNFYEYSHQLCEADAEAVGIEFADYIVGLIAA